jgi:hypothetical protein
MYSSADAARFEGTSDTTSPTLTRTWAAEAARVGKAGDARAQHFGDGELGAVAHELGVRRPPLLRPAGAAQPPRERQVVGAAAAQHQRGVRMGVHEARQQDVMRPLDGLAWVEATLRLVGGCHRDDSSGADRHGVVLEDAAVRFDRNHPAGADERVDGLQADRV